MNKSVKKRDRKSETSSRLVRCYYCNAEKEFKDFKSHCKNAHNKGPRQKGQLSLSESFLKLLAKRIKKVHPTPNEQHESLSELTPPIVEEQPLPSGRDIGSERPPQQKFS